MPRRPLPPGLKAPVVRFEDLAEKAGLSGINVSGSEVQQTYIVENTGTGVAIFDYDNDGLPDLFFVNGGPASTRILRRPTSSITISAACVSRTSPHRSGITIPIGARASAPATLTTMATSISSSPPMGPQRPAAQPGNGTFRDETKERGLAAPARWSTGCAFFDYDRDGHLDSGRGPLSRCSTRLHAQTRRPERVHVEGLPRRLRAPGPASVKPFAVSQRWPRPFHRRHQAAGVSTPPKSAASPF